MARFPGLPEYLIAVVIFGTIVISIVMTRCSVLPLSLFAAPCCQQVGAIDMQVNLGVHASMFGDETGLFCRILCFLAV
jgi:hypothetical protein